MHDPVLLDEAINALHIKKQETYIDATLGAGGHTIEMIKLGADVIGIDQDQKMIEIARTHIAEACPTSFSNKRGYPKLICANFKDIDSVVHSLSISHVSGVLMDLGISSLHLDIFERGFSFTRPQEMLDMRLDDSLGVTASDLLNVLDKNSLLELFTVALNYNQSKHLVSQVLAKRKETPFVTVGDFLSLFPRKIPGQKHPATQAMMALRIAVNTELAVIREALPKAINILSGGGRLVVISFHSTEDRIVKELFQDFETQGVARIITKKPIVPTSSELGKNPRARSAKMRVIEKLHEKDIHISKNTKDT